MSTARFKSILVVITDPFARNQPAHTKAAAIARRSGSRLTPFNSFMIPQPPGFKTPVRRIRIKDGRVHPAG